MSSDKKELEFSYDQIFWNEYECVVSGIILPFEKKPVHENVIIEFVAIKNDLSLDASDLSEEQIMYFKEQVIKRWDHLEHLQHF